MTSLAAEGELREAVPPLEIVTDTHDLRLSIEMYGGVYTSRTGFLRDFQEKSGFLEFDPDRLGVHQHREEFQNMLESDQILKRAHTQWYLELYMSGFCRLFGDRAAEEQCALRDVEDIPTGLLLLPRPAYTGELPGVLNNAPVVNALQNRLNLFYGENGSIYEPRKSAAVRVVMALYKDIAVSLEPVPVTPEEADNGIWSLVTETNLRASLPRTLGTRT